MSFTQLGKFPLAASSIALVQLQKMINQRMKKRLLEVEAATQFLADTKGEPTEMADLSQMMIGNVIYSIVFGNRYCAS